MLLICHDAAAFIIAMICHGHVTIAHVMRTCRYCHAIMLLRRADDDTHMLLLFRRDTLLLRCR